MLTNEENKKINQKLKEKIRILELNGMSIIRKIKGQIEDMIHDNFSESEDLMLLFEELKENNRKINYCKELLEI